MMATEPTLPTSNLPRRSPTELDEALTQIREALRGLEYGEVSVIVQDGLVIQIERTERKRLRRRTNK
ncbi:MAG TPA: YezD family protein [Pirellulales bacterium]|nr:YezD family protein [Pirellulales bacterium]